MSEHDYTVIGILPKKLLKINHDNANLINYNNFLLFLIT